LSFALLWIAATTQLAAQTPTLSHAVPSAAIPGQTNAITFFGDKLAGATELWTSFAAQVSRDPDNAKTETDSGKIVYRISLARDVPLGIGAIQIATTNGVSGLQLFMVDQLPSIVENGTNKTIQTAQALSSPVAVDGTCEELSADYYQITAAAGQRISVEAVAHRLGSSLDPVLRLLDSAGHELAYCDDAPGAGSDARFSHAFSSPGKYFIEIRDTRYQGGSKYRYRLRVGDFDLARIPYLPVAQSEFRLLSADAPAEAELEPNDSSTNATKISIPATLRGRFEKAGDRDFFQFEAREDQRLAFIGRTRSLGFPGDLFMQIYKADNSLLTEANVTGANDAGITNTFSEAGTFRLLVEELNRSGGSDFDYRVEIRPQPPGFALSVETDKLETPAGGTFDLKVSCVRRSYDGPIMLALAGAPSGFELKSPLLPAKTNETQMRVALPKNIDPGSIVHFGIIGYAKIGNAFFETQASTVPALRKLFPQMLNPLLEFDGLIGLGVKPTPPKTAEPAAAKATE
jgi:hypothetical protein